MTANGIILCTIAEALIFIIILYFIIKADIFINALHKEVGELNTCLTEIAREIRYDVQTLNAELSENYFVKPPSPEKLGMIAGKIFSEIIMFRISSLQFAKKYAILPLILKSINRPLKTKIVYRSVK